MTAKKASVFCSNGGHSPVDGQQFVATGGDEVGQYVESFFGMGCAFPNTEGVGVNTTIHNTIGVHGLNTQLEFVASITELGQTAGVPGLGETHSGFTGIEDVAIAEFGCTRQWAGSHKGLITPHGLVVPTPRFFPTVGNSGDVGAFGVAFKNDMGTTVEGGDGVGVLPLGAISNLDDLGSVKPFFSRVQTVDINGQGAFIVQLTHSTFEAGIRALSAGAWVVFAVADPGEFAASVRGAVPRLLRSLGGGFNATNERWTLGIPLLQGDRVKIQYRSTVAPPYETAQRSEVEVVGRVLGVFVDGQLQPLGGA